MRQTIAVLAVVLLASVLGLSEAAAYGGGGFFGSGRGTQSSGDDHSGFDGGKISRRRHALHRNACFSRLLTNPNSPI